MDETFLAAQVRHLPYSKLHVSTQATLVLAFLRGFQTRKARQEPRILAPFCYAEATWSHRPALSTLDQAQGLVTGGLACTGRAAHRVKQQNSYSYYTSVPTHNGQHGTQTT